MDGEYPEYERDTLLVACPYGRGDFRGELRDPIALELFAKPLKILRGSPRNHLLERQPSR